MTAERDTLAALLGYALDEEASIPALGLESVAHRVADRLIAAGVRVAPSPETWPDAPEDDDPDYREEQP